MSGVGGGRRITAADRRRQRPIRYVSRPAAISVGFELAVPAGDGQPDFNLDLGVGGGPQCSRDAAEFGQIAKQCSRSPAGARYDRLCESAGGDGLCQYDRGGGQLEGCQTVARGGECTRRAQEKYRAENETRAKARDYIEEPL